jgi:hypothetical protein
MQALTEKQYAIDQAVIVGITDVKGNITTPTRISAGSPATPGRS